MIRHPRLTALVLGVCWLGCSRLPERTSSAIVCPSVAPPSVDPSRRRIEESHEAWQDDVGSKDKFAGGRQAFETVRDSMLAQYHKEGITEDDMYRAATRGLLENVEPAMRKWNKLLTPDSVGRLRDDLKGQIVGIGVRVHIDAGTGRTEVASVVPSTPAARAGMLAGDLIVSVDGKLCNGQGTHEALDHLRGKVGQKLSISVLRGDKLITIEVEREVIAVDEVSHRIFAGSIGYVAVHSFSHRTRDKLKGAMEQLSSSQPKGLVLDLRDNMGGGFDDAVAVAEYFVPAGEAMIVLSKRGGRKETLSSKGSPLMASVPVIVLVNHDTSAAAEVLAAALQEKRRARIVGMPTLGKWNIQDVKDLPNGYAFKFTTALLQTPSGRSFEGTGLPPDVQVDMSDDQMARARDTQDPVARLAADPQLRTAVSMFDMSR